ncbi:SecC motif-containing protein [Aeromonas hydrophila]|nr:SecC motif-containing protein [Aeromonas hydrophila]
MCCGSLHRGAAAQTPEQLMRSRYSAFVLGLGSTWCTAGTLTI